MIALPASNSFPFELSAWTRACEAAADQRVDDAVLLDVQRSLSQLGRWDGVYILSVLARFETSVLIDAEGQVFLDWGTSGQVTLQPPIGAKAPFRLWVHTHPGFAAYWSGTDTHSLALGTGIVEKAMVLGEPGPKTSTNANFGDCSTAERLSSQGPLAKWSEEPPLAWDKWYETNGILLDVNQ